ncbi:hypothetical protein E2C01_015064 [Portunus trituberculatus]|uniref:Uncharacterized protein n=1 Tax=Portunus trituberculatus TaxID=210409 RepID=A0A5B7DLQ3_PORTR|nr:hypothetical protein [Portunus trituberculatus]
MHFSGLFSQAQKGKPPRCPAPGTSPAIDSDAVDNDVRVNIVAFGFRNFRECFKIFTFLQLSF